MTTALAIIFAYLLGSMPFGYIIYKMRKGGDIRKTGSAATGATNVARSLGIVYAIIVTVLDVSKGFFPVLLSMHLWPTNQWLHVAVAIAAIIGHCFPIWINFRGGKGVNTALGTAFAISWPAAIIAIGFFGVVFFVFKFVSIASLAAACVFSISILIFGSFIDAHHIAIEVYAIFLPAIIIFSHRSNIQRLIKGKELKPIKSEK
ncbi:glycerol-3-phosphate 1-O-acyltransferase PlsY [bacterium]|nr:glycerol-3-phosphate 1-O-acyltransferase PlsY [bacterium]